MLIKNSYENQMNLSPLTYLAGLILLSTLGALAWVDWKTFRLPNILTLPLIIIGLGYNAFIQDSVWPYVLGAALGYLAFVAIELAYKALRKQDGLGRGDAKLLAAGGAWCDGTIGCQTTAATRLSGPNMSP